MKFGRNTLKALLSNCMGFAQTVFWLHIFGYPLTVGYPLMGAVITVPIANAVLFRGIDKVLDRRSAKKWTKEMEERTCKECGWIHNCPLDHHEGCLHK